MWLLCHQPCTVIASILRQCTRIPHHVGKQHTCLTVPYPASTAGASSRQSGASGSLPPLSPSGGANTLNSSSGRSRRSIFASTTNSSGSSSGPASSRARGISTSSPMRERRKSSLITSRAQGYADMGDSIGSLPPISRDRGINRQHI